ncbi:MULTISPECIES: hypothetical protein [Aeromonas]|uniref:hypothetical protein n=1 Tax=Aeromonas TaxID=642 RepID=UPI0014329EDA|nr:hypothetical protein [Aeromonas caviae]NKD15262.1 hypothetical protein [Aeromonas caviae]
MVPKFNYNGELICPSCGFDYLHHDKVEVFECGEDAEHGVHVTISDGKAVMDTSLAGNPSARRHGLSVHFWCEGCDAKPVLSISQHKGNTQMTFE